MSNGNRKFYITTPIFYVNANPHIGHTYTAIAADILARYHRMIGDKTFFLTGTDEHGAKIEEKAKELGKDAKDFVDEVSAAFSMAWDTLNISNDGFIRTTDENHKKAVQNALQYMYDKGDIYKGEYEGLYCRGCEQFKAENDLVDGLCPDHKTAPEKMSEECYMFKMSQYQEELVKKIENDEYQILPIERKNEILSFLKEKLQDVSFSRKNVKWGIPLPWDGTHTTYVWADAFLNYLTGLGWEGPKEELPAMWPADLQLMSKDILRVHATIWPAMLLSLGLPLPKTLFIHGFFLVDGQKMSKSLGNVIAPNDLVKKYGVDATRYLLASATSFGQDGDIGWTKFDEKFNADLANGLGNLVSRSLTLVLKMKEAGMGLEKKGIIETFDGIEFNHAIAEKWEKYQEHIAQFRVDLSLKIFEEQIRFLDGYITATKPWALIKDNDARVGAVMYNVLERLRHISWMILPFMPETAEKIWVGLGLDPKKETKKSLEEVVGWGGLSVDSDIKKPEPLFPRI